MPWRKLGLVHAPDGARPWAQGLAAFPTAHLRDADTLRVYFTGLDAEQFGRGAFVDVDPADPTRVLAVSQEPVLDLGPVGDFDDAGANPYSVVDAGGRRLMFYAGWQRTARAPFQIFTGVAEEQPDGTFRRLRRTPVLERTEAEPHLRSAACVLATAGGFTAWYMASDRWAEHDGRLHPTPAIRRADSPDGVAWTARPEPALSPRPDEYGLGRPAVIHDGGRWRMWFSARTFGRPYAIGYAESDDGLAWRRDDARAGIGRSASGWDSEMIAHPNVVRVRDRLLMFYNGNAHGASGFGCAVWEDD